MTNEASLLVALADPTRRAIFERLGKRPASVADLTRGMTVSQPAVSQHLKVLKQAGLVSAKPDGAKMIYRIDPAGLGPLRAWLDRFWKQQLASFKDVAEGGESR